MSHDWPCRCQKCERDLRERDLLESPLAPQKTAQEEMYDRLAEESLLEWRQAA